MRGLPIIVLILLQALAPVLHAHVGGDHAGRGLHLHPAGKQITGQTVAGVSTAPGLEVRVTRALAPRAETLRTASTPAPDLLSGPAFPLAHRPASRIISLVLLRGSLPPGRRGFSQHPSRAPPAA